MKCSGIIFSNIYDKLLGELTNNRTVASLPFGGRYRLIDFVLSNMTNSGLVNVGVITKYNYKSLMEHLRYPGDWDMGRKNGGLTVLPPFAAGNTRVYRGKIEALYSVINYIEAQPCECIVMSDCTVVCNIDYRPIIRQHINSKADITVVVNEEKFSKNSNQSLCLTADKSGKVTSVYTETPVYDDLCVGMGIYVVNKEYLIDAVKKAYSKGYYHFERDLIQKNYNEGSVRLFSCKYDGLVLRNDSISAYFENNLRLLNKETNVKLFLKQPIYTRSIDTAPSYYGERSNVRESIVADGCILRGSIDKSVIFRNVSTEEHSDIISCIVMQGAVVSEGAHIKNAIIDKDVFIGKDVKLVGTKDNPVVIKKGTVVNSNE